MRLDDRAADRKPHPHAVRFGRYKRLEDRVGHLGGDPWPGIGDGDLDGAAALSAGHDDDRSPLGFPASIASIAFRSRFTNTCSICTRSARTACRPSSIRTSISTSHCIAFACVRPKAASTRGCISVRVRRYFNYTDCVIAASAQISDDYVRLGFTFRLFVVDALLEEIMRNDKTIARSVKDGHIANVQSAFTMVKHYERTLSLSTKYVCPSVAVARSSYLIAALDCGVVLSSSLSEQGQGAVPHVIMGLGANMPDPQRQTRLRALQRLAL